MEFGVKHGEDWRELAYRASDGVEVSLFWSKDDDELVVRVSDGRTRDSFELPVGKANPLDVFYHPYAYAAFAGLDHRTAPSDEPEIVAPSR
jgi:hypothetical protein